FGGLAKMPSDGFPYPIFVFAALLPWTFFANAITNSANSLVGSSNLVSKVYFPRLIIPLSSVCADRCYASMRIDSAFNRLKDFRRIATRYDKLSRNYKASICLAAVLVWWI